MLLLYQDKQKMSWVLSSHFCNIFKSFYHLQIRNCVNYACCDTHKFSLPILFLLVIIPTEFLISQRSLLYLLFLLFSLNFFYNTSCSDLYPMYLFTGLVSCVLFYLHIIVENPSIKISHR